MLEGRNSEVESCARRYPSLISGGSMLQSVSKLGVAVFVVAIASCGAAFAQDQMSNMRTACKADYEKYCKDTPRGGGRIIACLDKQQLSDECRKVVDARKK
jgi:hypothetical protein